MQVRNIVQRFLLVSTTLFAISLALMTAGCERHPEAANTRAAASPASDSHTHTEGDGHEHAHPAAGSDGVSHEGHDHDDPHDHGDTTPLGEQAIQGFVIRASRDADIIAGKDTAIDVWVVGGEDAVQAVRFWVGTQDAKGSVKAKADLGRDHWHTHAEIPSPLPQGSRLWVELELETGEPVLASFELKN